MVFMFYLKTNVTPYRIVGREQRRWLSPYGELGDDPNPSDWRDIYKIVYEYLGGPKGGGLQFDDEAEGFWVVTARGSSFGTRTMMVDKETLKVSEFEGIE